MGDFGAFVVIAIIAVVLWSLVQESGKRASRERSVAYESQKHISSFLRERTNSGPWYEMNDFYRENYVDVKCTSCERDSIFVSNDNELHESEFIDVHYAKGKLRIMHGEKVLFSGDPLNLMSYPQEAYALRKDSPPPKEADIYATWANHFKVD
jgi:hypothetical protein